MKRILVAVILSATIIFANGTVQASTLYVTNYVTTADMTANPWGVSILDVQAGAPVTTTSSWLHGPLLGTPPSIEEREFMRGAIAVDGRIDVAGPFNHTYNLDGSGQVSTICGLCPYVPYAADGATDGLYNYTIGPETLGSGTVGIWRTDRDWHNESFLFSTTAVLAAGEQASGITYDPTSSSLWVLATGGTSTRILELGLDGSFRSGFDTPYVGKGALAMDYADNTLWWVPQGDRTSDYYYLTQFNRQGLQLSASQITAGSSIYGAEFNLGSPVNPVISPVPEPETYAMLLAGLGLIGFTTWRRKEYNV